MLKLVLPLYRVYSRNLEQCSVLATKDTFLKKGQQAFYNFHIRGQRSIAERSIGLGYALLYRI